MTDNGRGKGSHQRRMQGCLGMQGFRDCNVGWKAGIVGNSTSHINCVGHGLRVARTHPTRQKASHVASFCEGTTVLVGPVIMGAPG